MSISFNTLVLNALSTGEAYVKAIEALKASLKGKKYDSAYALVMPIVATKYNVPLVDGKGKAKGRKVMNSTAKSYEAAKDAIQVILKDCEIYYTSAPKKSNRTEPVKPVNPFARIVSKFKTKQQALKAFEEAWASKTK